MNLGEVKAKETRHTKTTLHNLISMKCPSEGNLQRQKVDPSCLELRRWGD
jgi:hypothetical protein